MGYLRRGVGNCLILLFLGACGGLAGSSVNNATSSSGTSDTSGQGLSESGVSELTINSASGTADVSFGDLNGTEEYIVGVYSYNEEGNSNTIELSSLSEASLSEASLNTFSSKSLKAVTTSSSDVLEDKTEDFHQMLREEEEAMEDISQGTVGKMLGASKSNPTPAIGTQRNFTVYGSLTTTSSMIQTTSTLIAVTSHLECWRDNNGTTMSDEEVTDICDEVDIYIPIEEALFSAQPSDMDGNSRVILHFTPTVNQIGGASGGIVTAYFSAALLSKDGEVMHMLVPDEKGTFGPVVKDSFYRSNFTPFVPLHEFQHVMSYNMHVLVNRGSAEKSAFNEAASHFAEGIPSIVSGDASDGGFPVVAGLGPESPSRIGRGLSQINSVSFAHGASLPQRGLATLFFRLIYDLAKSQQLTGPDPALSGAEFLSRFENNDKVGIANMVASATGEEDNPAGIFTQLIGKFAVAILQNTIYGIDLYAKQNDNRNTTLNGPEIHEVTSLPLQITLGGSSIGFYRVTASQIRSAGGALSIHIDDTDHAGAFIIQSSE